MPFCVFFRERVSSFFSSSWVAVASRAVTLVAPRQPGPQSLCGRRGVFCKKIPPINRCAVIGRAVACWRIALFFSDHRARVLLEKGKKGSHRHGGPVFGCDALLCTRNLYAPLQVFLVRGQTHQSIGGSMLCMPLCKRITNTKFGGNGRWGSCGSPCSFRATRIEFESGQCRMNRAQAGRSDTLDPSEA